ncbi:MAG: CoA transferase, partial [Anaerolineae bacterium]|nr:CoA transferase [Anaerolineae bacterium]
RLGVGPQILMAHNPRLVYCALTGYGQTGPLRDVVGHDINYIGTAGLLDLNGPPDGPPVVPGAQLADLSGALVATLGILAALLRRATMGEGGVVDTSMTEAVFALLSLPWAEFAGAAQAARRGAHILSGGWACYNVYQAADGRYLALGCLEPKFWAAFCQAVEQPDWIIQQFDPSLQPALKTRVAALLGGQPASVWLDQAQGRDIPLTLVNSLADLPADPQFAARDVLFQTAAGLAARSPIRLDDLPPAATTPPPGYGDTSAAALLEAWSDT